jgi:hypothetical protein
MILCYCHENVSEGLALLKHAAESRGHLPSMYALAIILRDMSRVESDMYLELASERDHLPAWQERLSSFDMRIKFGDIDASDLARYLDPSCLGRLLGRHYLESKRARKLQTSHCWNPRCGRWAYKAAPPPAPNRDHAIAAAAGGVRLGGIDGGDDNDVRGGEQRLMRVGFRAFWNDRVGGRVDRGFLAAPRNDDDDGIDGAARQRRLLVVGARLGILEPINDDNVASSVIGNGGDDNNQAPHERETFSIESLLNEQLPRGGSSGRNNGTNPDISPGPSPLEELLRVLREKSSESCGHGLKVSRMKMCSSCRRAKYCSKLCQVYDWRSGKHKMECQFL